MGCETLTSCKKGGQVAKLYPPFFYAHIKRYHIVIQTTEGRKNLNTYTNAFFRFAQQLVRSFASLWMT